MGQVSAADAQAISAAMVKAVEPLAPVHDRRRSPA
jgi:hypothetical protein